MCGLDHAERKAEGDGAETGEGRENIVGQAGGWQHSLQFDPQHNGRCSLRPWPKQASANDVELTAAAIAEGTALLRSDEAMPMLPIC